MRGVGSSGFGDTGDGGVEAEFFAQNGSGHAGEEFGGVVFVGPFRWGAGAEDGVEVALEVALGGHVHGEEDQTEVNGVCGGFMAGEDEDEGVTEDLGVGHRLGWGLLAVLDF